MPSYLNPKSNRNRLETYHRILAKSSLDIVKVKKARSERDLNAGNAHVVYTSSCNGRVHERAALDATTALLGHVSLLFTALAYSNRLGA